MKKAKEVKSSLCCKATASLNVEILEDMEKQDKSLGNLLNVREKQENSGVCRRKEDGNKGC
jgi:hypothetical protein